MHPEFPLQEPHETTKAVEFAIPAARAATASFDVAGQADAHALADGTGILRSATGQSRPSASARRPLGERIGQVDSAVPEYSTFKIERNRYIAPEARDRGSQDLPYLLIRDYLHETLLRPFSTAGTILRGFDDDRAVRRCQSPLCSTHWVRHAGGSNGSAKYCVS